MPARRLRERSPAADPAPIGATLRIHQAPRYQLPQVLPAFLHDPPGEGTLSAYYVASVRPTLRMGSTARETSDRAVTRINFVVGHYVRLDEIDPPTLDRYFHTLADEGLGKATVERERRALLAILETWNPTFLPPNRGAAELLKSLMRASPAKLRDQRKPLFLKATPGPRTLARYFGDVFLPQNPQIKQHSAAEYGRDVRRLDVLAGRYVRLDEIDEAVIERYYKLMVKGGFKRDSARKRAATVQRVVNFFEPGRLGGRSSAANRIREKKHCRPKRAAFLDQPPEQGTLAHFFTHVYSDSLIGKSTSHLKNVSLALRRFDVMLGHYARFDELTAELFERFQCWMLDGGWSCYTANHERIYVQAVARAALPHKFGPKPRGWAGRLPELPPAAPGSLREFFERTYVPLRLMDAAPFTIAQHRYDLARLHRHFQRDVLLTECTDELLAAYLKSQLDRGISTVTMNTLRKRLLALTNFAHECGKIDTRPRVKKLKPHREAPDAWSAEELQRILATAAKLGRSRQHAFHEGRFWTAYLLVGFQTALRRKTLLALRGKDVDLEAGILSVPALAMKNRRGQRFRLAPNAVDALRALRTKPEEFLLAWPYGTKYFETRFRYIISKAEVKPSARRTGSTAHKLRRTSATHVAMAGGMTAAMALLGHSASYVSELYVDASKLPASDFTRLLPTLATASCSDAATANGEAIVEAQKLLSLEMHHAATMMARLALERWLKGLLAIHSMTSRRSSLMSYIGALHSGGRFGADQANTIRGLAAALNRVAHGDAIEPQEARRLVAAVRTAIGN